MQVQPGPLALFIFKVRMEQKAPLFIYLLQYLLQILKTREQNYKSNIHIQAIIKTTQFPNKLSSTECQSSQNLEV